jgi:hypothetical protein
VVVLPTPPFWLAMARKGARGGQQRRQRRHGACDEGVVVVGRAMILDPRAHHIDVRECQFDTHLGQETGTLGARLEQRHGEIRARDGQHHAGQAIAAADIQHATAARIRHHRQAVDELFAREGRRGGGAGQVGDLPPAHDHGDVPLELLEL